MIYTKNLDKINNLKNNNFYVVADFDRTLTDGDSISSWGILPKSNLINSDYMKERDVLFNKYHPLELDNTLDFDLQSKFMQEWWEKHTQLLVKYQISEEMINKETMNADVMLFRKDCKEFLKELQNRNIPLIIISAGIGNFIELFLRNNNCYYNNIYVISNFIEFKDGIANGMSNEIIHTLNKNEAAMPNKIKQLIKDKEKIILLGDSLGDLKMVDKAKKEQTLSIGFLEENVEQNKQIYLDEFDVVCTNNTSFKELLEKINLFQKEEQLC